MHGKPPGPLILAIISVLTQEGEATVAEISALTGLPSQNITVAVRRMLNPSKMYPKRAHIAGWTRTDESGRRAYLRAILALGDAPDAPRPKAKENKKCTAEYRARTRHKVNSVFMWAQPRHVRETARRKIK